MGADSIVFEGTAEPGATVEIKDTTGTVLASGTADENGNWTATVPYLPEGLFKLTIVAGDKPVPYEYVAVVEAESTPVMDPTIGDVAAAAALAAGLGVMVIRRRRSIA